MDEWQSVIFRSVFLPRWQREWDRDGDGGRGGGKELAEREKSTNNVAARGQFWEALSQFTSAVHNKLKNERKKAGIDLNRGRGSSGG